MSEPSSNNVVVGDAQVVNAMFNTPPTDLTTGLPSTPRHDLDMDTSHEGDKRTGRRMVSATTRNDHFNERVLLDATTMHVTDGNDATRFTDMVLELNEVLGYPGLATAYDMAMYAANHDRMRADGTATVGTVHPNAKSQPKSLQLGEHTFTLVDGTKQGLEVLVVDGWPGIIIPTIDGRKWVALEPLQSAKAQNNDGPSDAGSIRRCETSPRQRVNCTAQSGSSATRTRPRTATSPAARRCGSSLRAHPVTRRCSPGATTSSRCAGTPHGASEGRRSDGAVLSPVGRGQHSTDGEEEESDVDEPVGVGTGGRQRRGGRGLCERLVVAVNI